MHSENHINAESPFTRSKMHLILEKRPRNPIIISGFPGFGLVGTITTEFLVKHLDAKPIGKIRVDEVPPVIAVHKGDAIEPLGIFYDKKTNIVILHALTAVNGLEWGLAEILIRIAKELKAREIISIEGVGSSTPDQQQEPKAFYIGESKKMKDSGVEPLREGIIVGVTGALLLRKDVRVTCIFSETHSTLPDSRASAKVIEVLDRYLNLKVDFKPLLKKAEEFESKIKDMMEKAHSMTAQKDKKKLTYFG